MKKFRYDDSDDELQFTLFPSSTILLLLGIFKNKYLIH